MSSFERKFIIEGTLEQLENRLELPYENNRHKLHLINRLLSETGIKASERFYDELKVYGADHIDINLSVLKPLGWGYIANATDSIMLRFIEDPPGYSCRLEIRLRYDGEMIRLDVDDNGKGIDEDIEPVLFSGELWSTKRNLSDNLIGVLHGCGGRSLKETYDSAIELGGSVGYQNKGVDKGAVFWYEIPVGCVIR